MTFYTATTKLQLATSASIPDWWTAATRASVDVKRRRNSSTQTKVALPPGRGSVDRQMVSNCPLSSTATLSPASTRPEFAVPLSSPTTKSSTIVSLHIHDIVKMMHGMTMSSIMMNESSRPGAPSRIASISVWCLFEDCFKSFLSLEGRAHGLMVAAWCSRADHPARRGAGSSPLANTSIRRPWCCRVHGCSLPPAH